MDKFVTTGLLLAALVLPVALFFLLRSRSRLHSLAVAAIAIATGWALNVAWAFSQANTGETLSIAMRFGWACPSVLVFLTWLVWRFKTRREVVRQTRGSPQLP
jgi:hypothetical protein